MDRPDGRKVVRVPTHWCGGWGWTDPMVGRSCASLPTGSVGGDGQTRWSEGRARPYPLVWWVGMHRPDGRKVVRVPTHGFGGWGCTDPMVGRSCASLPTGSVGGDAQTRWSEGRARPYPRVRWVGMHRPDGRKVVRVPTHGFGGWGCTDPMVGRT